MKPRWQDINDELFDNNDWLTSACHVFGGVIDEPEITTGFKIKRYCLEHLSLGNHSSWPTHWMPIETPEPPEKPE